VGYGIRVDLWTTSVYDRAIDLVLICCNVLCRMIWRRTYKGKSTSDLSKSRKVKGHLANRQIKIRTRRHEGSKFQHWQLYQCNDCNGRFTTLQSLYTWQHCGHVGSVELWNVKVVKPTGSYWGEWRLMSYDSACVVWGRSPISHKVSSWNSFTSVY